MTENITDSETKIEQAFSGKIAVITSHISVSEDDYNSADGLTVKYGKDKIIHVTWPVNFVTDKKEMMDIITDLAADKDLKVLIINHALPGTNAAVDKFKEIRNDVFILYCVAHETADEVTKRANLILGVNELGMGAAMVKQARKQGAKVFVHYSFPRHMAIPSIKDRWNMIHHVCDKEDIQFINTMVPDPVGGSGFSEAQQFIFNDVEETVAKYGDDTAFFCTNCNLQAPLIEAVVDNHAIYPQPCCPSPFHGFPEALGIEIDSGQMDLNHVITEACCIAEEKNMTDRLSTWPVPAHMMFVNAGAEYAIKWINGEVSRNRINDKVLEDCMNAYIKEVVGESIEVTMESHIENGITYENCKLMLMNYLDF